MKTLTNAKLNSQVVRGTICQNRPDGRFSYYSKSFLVKAFSDRLDLENAVISDKRRGAVLSGRLPETRVSIRAANGEICLFVDGIKTGIMSRKLLKGSRLFFHVYYWTDRRFWNLEGSYDSPETVFKAVMARMAEIDY